MIHLDGLQWAGLSGSMLEQKAHKKPAPGLHWISLVTVLTFYCPTNLVADFFYDGEEFDSRWGQFPWSPTTWVSMHGYGRFQSYLLELGTPP